MIVYRFVCDECGRVMHACHVPQDTPLMGLLDAIPPGWRFRDGLLVCDKHQQTMPAKETIDPPAGETI